MKKFDEAIEKVKKQYTGNQKNQDKIGIDSSWLFEASQLCLLVKEKIQTNENEHNLLLFVYEISCEATDTYHETKTLYLKNDLRTGVVEDKQSLLNDVGDDNHFTVVDDNLDQALERFYINLLNEPFDIKIDEHTAMKVVKQIQLELENFLSLEPICNIPKIQYVIGCIPNTPGAPFWHFIELRWLHASSLQTAKELSQDEQDDISNW